MILRSDPKPAHVQRTTPQRESHGGKGMEGWSSFVFVVTAVRQPHFFSTTYSMLERF